MSKLLKDSTEMLKNIRVELHGSVDDSVLKQLDSVILDLEAAQKKQDMGQAIDVAKLLVSFGMLLTKFPELAKAIEAIVELIKNTPNH